METFIQEVISLYYKSDDDVAKDTELQAWALDIHENGFPVREDDADHELPKSLATREQLVHVLTCVVFTCSCQHAAANFGLMDVHGFVPFTPSLMRLPPPTKKNEATLKSIMNTLPNKSQASRQIALMYVLSQFAEDEVRKRNNHQLCPLKTIYILASRNKNDLRIPISRSVNWNVWSGLSAGARLTADLREVLES